MARGLDRLLDADIAGQDDHVGDRGSGFRRDRFQDAQNLGQTLWLVAFPAVLWGKTDARAIGAAALVRTAEGAGAVPGGRDHFGGGQPAVGDLGLHGGDVIAGVACGDRILPDQIFGRNVGAIVIGLRSHVAVGQLEPGAGEGVGEILGIGAETLADLVVDRIDLHRHVGVGHHRHFPLRRVRRVKRHLAFRHVDRLPLVRACGRLRQFPLIAEQVVEIAHVPLGRMLGPGALDPRGEGVGCQALVARVGPAKALRVNRATFRLGSDMGEIAAAMRLADGVASACQRRGFLVVHRHAGERLTYMQRGLRRIGFAVHAFGVHIDEAHVDGGQRVLQRRRSFQVAIAVFRRCQPLALATPIDVLFGPPDVLAAKAEAECLQAHRFIGHVAGQDDQVGPAQRVAVLLLHRPQKAASLVQAGVVGPGIQRSEADIAGPGAATSVAHPVRACGMPGQTDHQPAVMPPVGRPPILALGHQRADIGLDGFEIQRLDRFPVIVVRIHRIGPGAMLVQDVKVERIGPPFGDGRIHGRIAAVHDRAAATDVLIVAIHGNLLC